MANFYKQTKVDTIYQNGLTVCVYNIDQHRHTGDVGVELILSTTYSKLPTMLWLQIPVIARLNIMSSIMKFLRHKGGVIAAAAEIKRHRYAIITEIL